MKTSPTSPVGSLGRALLFACLAFSTTAAYGQGEILFNNRLLPSFFAPIYGPQPDAPNLILHGNAITNGGALTYSGPLLLGSGYTAALYYGPEGATDPDSLILLATAPFRSQSSLAGTILAPAPAVTVPGYSAGGLATFEVRAWDNKGGTLTTWAQVLADPTAARGSSGLLTALVKALPDAPGLLTGLQSFCIHLPTGAAEITSQPHDAIVPPGGSTNFSVTVISAATLSYQWMFNGAPISSATAATLTITNANYTQAGNYHVVVTTDSSLSLTSHVARLIVQPSIAAIDKLNIEEWGVDAVRMTCDSTPNRTVHVEASTLTESSWIEVGSFSSPVIRGYFFDVFSTNLSRIYRLRTD